MTKLQIFLKWVSTKVPFKIPAGKGTTIEEVPEPDENRLVVNAPKYKVKPDITFIYVSNRRNNKGEVCHELLCDKTRLTFLVSENLFKALFENISLNTKVN
jgi:hypothetical protein